MLLTTFGLLQRTNVTWSSRTIFSCTNEHQLHHKKIWTKTLHFSNFSKQLIERFDLHFHLHHIDDTSTWQDIYYIATTPAVDSTILCCHINMLQVHYSDVTTGVDAWHAKAVNRCQWQQNAISVAPIWYTFVKLIYISTNKYWRFAK